jgi:hypothetical protein
MLLRSPKAPTKPGQKRADPAAAGSAKDAPAVGRGQSTSGTGDPELDEIEQLLRRRGIT